LNGPQISEGRLTAGLLEILRDQERLTIAAGLCWPDLLNAVRLLQGEATNSILEVLHPYDWPAEPLALLARLLEEANIDVREPEQQILQADENQSPGLLAQLAMLSDMEKHPKLEAIQGDTRANGVGFWGRVHLSMLAGNRVGLRIERRGSGIVASTWDTTPPTAEGEILFELLYSGQGSEKGRLRFAESAPAYKLAQRLLNLAGIEAGHGFITSPVPQSLRPKRLSAAETNKAVLLYDAAREIYLGSDALDYLAFIGQRKALLELPLKEWASLLKQAKRDQIRALELNRPDTAVRFAILRGEAALHVSDRKDVASAFHSLRDALPFVPANSQAIAVCYALLEQLRTALRNLPEGKPAGVGRSHIKALLMRALAYLRG
jgi:hypothetical protein